MTYLVMKSSSADGSDERMVETSCETVSQIRSNETDNPCCPATEIGILLHEVECPVI
jgi:hypothetical protein